MQHDHPCAIRDDEVALPPAESLSLLERQAEQTRQRTDVNPALVCAVWGAAWLLGFGLFYLGAGPQAVLEVPLWVVGVTFAALLGAALVTQIVHTTRACRGVQGVSAETGALYGGTWVVGLLGLNVVLNVVVNQGISDDGAALLWPSAYGLLVAVLLMAGGVLWRDRVQYGLGAWIGVADVAGAVVGLPGYYLVMSLAGGGGLLLASALVAARRHRRRARP